MSETRRETPELERLTAQISFSEEQLAQLRKTVDRETAVALCAKEIYDKAYELSDMGDVWTRREDILKKTFIDFFEGEELIKWGMKVLDLHEFDMPVDMQFQADDPKIIGRNFGLFRLEGINLVSGEVIIGSCVRRDDPSELQSETESWFAFIADPSIYEQEVEVLFCPDDDEGEAVHQELLPVLAGEEDKK